MLRLFSTRAERTGLTLALALALALALLLLAPRPAAADEARPASPRTPFYQGQTRFGLSGGGYGGSGQLDFYIAGSVGYFLVDNLELGGDLAVWFGDSPTTFQLGPALRYIVPLDGPVQPYVGVFYRHWFVSGADPDVDTLGARAGLLIHSDHVYFHIGAAYEAVVSTCYGECGDLYPEFGLSIVL